MKDTNTKRKNLFLLAAIVFIVSITVNMLGCKKDSVTPREGSIQGKITNLSGVAIKDALVSWEYDNTRWAITEPDGSYYVDGIGFGDQTFIVEAKGYRSQRFIASVYSGRTTTVNAVSMQASSFSYSGIKVEKVTATTALIKWNTSDYTNAVIEYGLTKSLGKYAREKEDLFTTTHSFELTGLVPEKTYYFKISSSRKGQTIESSDISNFTTLSSFEDGNAPNPPTNVETSLTGLSGQIAVFWNAVSDEDLKGYKIYRSDVSNGEFTAVSNGFVARGQERFTDNSVIPGKKYYYHVTAVDQANNESGYNNVAEILVPGNITTDVTWNLANSPYVVLGDINVSEFGALHIDGGVKVIIAESDGLRAGQNEEKIEITVKGGLIASASYGLPITISSRNTNAAKASWQGISFVDSTNVSNSMVNFVISDADTAISLSRSSGAFSNLELINNNTGMSLDSCSDVTINKLDISRTTLGCKLQNNTNVCVSNSKFMHPTNCIISSENNGLIVTGCDMLEFTDTAIISEEKGGIVEFTNNLFVSPLCLGLQVNGKCQKIEHSVFDTPYAIQIKSEIPFIGKNLFMSECSSFGEGKKCIEYLNPTAVLPEFGPNNVEGYPEGNDYIGCVASSDSTSTSDIILVKDISGDTYDYRLRQPYPSVSDCWGITRD